MSKEFRTACLAHCLENAPDGLSQLFEQFCRLNGYKLATAGINEMIDKASGYQKQVINEFTFFLAKYIYLPLLRQNTCKKTNV